MNHWRSSYTSSITALSILALTQLGVASPNTIIESSFGEFSGNSLSPTVIASGITTGTNIISGRVNSHTFSLDHDYFRLSLPESTRLTRMAVRISGYESFLSTSGIFEVLPALDGNLGGLTILGNSTNEISFTIGNPTNIVFHFVAPFVLEMGGSAAYNYEVELVLEPLEVVGGTLIHNAVEIVFPSEAGTLYRLQCCSDLSTSDWKSLGQPIAGTGAEMSAFDSTRRAQRMFYRVIKQ